MESGNVTPFCTAAAPRCTATGVMKLSVPRWSSGPHRPQLETLAARSFSSWGSGTDLLLRVLLAQLVLEDLAGRVAGQHVDDLELLGNLLGHETGVLAERRDVIER